MDEYSHVIFSGYCEKTSGNPVSCGVFLEMVFKASIVISSGCLGSGSLSGVN